MNPDPTRLARVRIHLLATAAIAMTCAHPEHSPPPVDAAALAQPVTRTPAEPPPSPTPAPDVADAHAPLDAAFAVVAPPSPARDATDAATSPHSRGAVRHPSPAQRRRIRDESIMIMI